jgi:type II secretory pathway predicted ATPase ExeA
VSTSYRDEKRRLQTFFHFSRMPFIKNFWAKCMFESKTQAELKDGIQLWSECRGICLICGPNGAGKSITLRRFCKEMDDKRNCVYYLCTIRCTALGFFRSLCRTLGIAPRQSVTDMFDAISQFLAEHEKRSGKHPILIIDDADVLDDDLLEALRRLTNFEMDGEDRFSLVLVGMPELGTRLKQPQNSALHQRVSFAHYLRGFSLEDTQNYIAFHLERSDGHRDLFKPEAIKLLFNVSKGYPRSINQLALQSLIQAAIRKEERISEGFIKDHVLSNPLFDPRIEVGQND